MYKCSVMAHMMETTQDLTDVQETVTGFLNKDGKLKLVLQSAAFKNSSGMES